MPDVLTPDVQHELTIAAGITSSRNNAPMPGKVGKQTSAGALKQQLAPGDDRPQRRTMDAAILPVSCRDINASVRADI
jgi:hypothetical protein